MAQNLSNDHVNLTMLTDFYEITMANGYFTNGFKDTIGYFDMFFRKVPDGGGFAIMAGVEPHRNEDKPHRARCGRQSGHGVRLPPCTGL